MSLGTFTERFLLVCAGLLWVASAQDSGRVGKLTCVHVLCIISTNREYPAVNCFWAVARTPRTPCLCDSPLCCAKSSLTKIIILSLCGSM